MRSPWIQRPVAVAKAPWRRVEEGAVGTGHAIQGRAGRGIVHQMLEEAGRTLRLTWARRHLALLRLSVPD